MTVRSDKSDAWGRIGHEGGWGTCKKIKTEPDAQLLSACPVLWEEPPLTTLQAIFVISAQDWGTSSGELPKPVRRAGHCCLEGKGPPIQQERKQEGRVKVIKAAVQELEKSLPPGAASGCPN